MIEKAHPIGLRGLAAIGIVLASSAYAWASLTDIRSEVRVVIEDKTGHPITRLDGDCRREVRETDGAILQNAVSCAVPESPTLWSVVAALLEGEPFAFWGLAITTGSEHDEIRADIPPTTNIGLLSINAGDGPDDVYLNTRSVSDPDQYRWEAWVVGGQGPDLIVTGPERDNVWGDVLIAGVEPPGNHSDKIMTQDGEDDANGQWGHDLMLTGRHDDDLSGGSGNNVLVGGGGADAFRNGNGNVLIAARELSGPQVIDRSIDCGSGAKRYATFSDGQDAAGNEELGLSCDGPPPTLPMIDTLLAALRDPRPADGNWQWIG